MRKADVVMFSCFLLKIVGNVSEGSISWLLKVSKKNKTTKLKWCVWGETQRERERDQDRDRKIQRYEVYLNTNTLVNLHGVVISTSLYICYF